MDKGRKTTLEERLKIVQFTLDNQKDYQSAAEKYQVSYQQVYGWVRKYELDGKDGLLDRRGRKLQMENDYLKKLNQIERELEGYR